MAAVLASVDAVPGRMYPLVATLLELARRGHRVVVRCGIDDVERLRLFQNDRAVAEAACAAFAGAPFDVVVTTVDVDPAGLEAPPNVRAERFLPHAPLLARASCVV